MKKLELPKTKELTPIEVVILSNIYCILNTMEAYKNTIIENAEDYFKVSEASQLLRCLNKLGLLNELRIQFWDYASVETLSRIINESKFTLQYEWSSSTSLIDKRVLRGFSSWDKISNNDPKAELAKKLGATITV